MPGSANGDPGVGSNIDAPPLASYRLATWRIGLCHVSLDLPAESLSRLDQAIATIEEIFVPFVSLSVEEIRGFARKGARRRTFVGKRRWRRMR